MAREKVLIINTGGTIAMVHSEPLNPLTPLVPVSDWSQVAENYPILKPELLGVETDYLQLERIVDSSNISYDYWRRLARTIADNYADYSGFVILHGTDTMCYTASALSFMMENLAKPVILTGSQLPMAKPRSDAAQNLVTAIHIAAASSFSNRLVPEVCIFFRDVLIRGNRSRKFSSSGYTAFASPNYPPLATAGESINFSSNYILKRPKNEQEFYVNPTMDTRVMIVEMFPGFNPTILRNMFDESSSEEKLKGIVLKTFGAGNVPTSEDFLSTIEYLSKAGVAIVNVTQCPEGMVELGLYEASAGLLNRGVVSGIDLTPEAAVCKLMFLLGQGWPAEEVKAVMQLNLKGEQSLNIHNIELAAEGEAEGVFKSARKVPGNINLNRVTRASIHIQGTSLVPDAEEAERLRLGIFLNHPGADETTPMDDARLGGLIDQQVRAGESVDLFCDLTASTKRLIKPGQMTAFSIVTDASQTIRWEKIVFSLYTSVL